MTALDVVRRYHAAWTGGDVAGALLELADTAACQFPGGPTVDRAGWGEYLTGFVPMLTGVGDLVEVADGERVALFYRPHTAATSTALAGELFTVRDGKIHAISLVFDRLSYGPPSA